MPHGSDIIKNTACHILQVSRAQIRVGFKAGALTITRTGPNLSFVRSPSSAQLTTLNRDEPYSTVDRAIVWLGATSETRQPLYPIRLRVAGSTVEGQAPAPVRVAASQEGGVVNKAPSEESGVEDESREKKTPSLCSNSIVPWPSREGLSDDQLVVGLLAAIDAVRNDAQECDFFLFGWQIRYKLRRGSYERGDYTMVDPRDGQRIYSMVGLIRKLSRLNLTEVGKKALREAGKGLRRISGEPLERAFEEPPVAKRLREPDFVEGDAVEVQFGTDWFSGRVSRVTYKKSRTHYAVKFDDGDFYEDVRVDEMRVPQARNAHLLSTPIGEEGREQGAKDMEGEKEKKEDFQGGEVEALSSNPKCTQPAYEEPLERAFEEPPVAKRLREPDFVEGDAVEVQFGTDWFSGRVSRVTYKKSRTHYAVKFDDGDFYEDVRVDEMRVPQAHTPAPIRTDQAPMKYRYFARDEDVLIVARRAMRETCAIWLQLAP